MRNILAASPLSLALVLASPALADSGKSAPQPVPIVSTIADAKDTPYPGTIALNIDASDITRAVYRVTETVPVEAGTTDLVLQYPRWIPGNHAPDGTISELADIHFRANGQELSWRRDPVEVFAFHIALPAGATSVTASFIDSSPLQGSEGRITTTREMLDLQWDRMSLYPAGHFVRQIHFKPTVTLPAGWSAASALNGKQVSGNTVSFADVDYETMVDSPMWAGANFARYDLGHNVALNAFGDKAEQVKLKPEDLGKLQALVSEAGLAFGAYHFDHYDFLTGLSDRIGGIGLEHHRSNESTLDPKSFTDWAGLDWDRNVLAHEFSHSWDGKFRRPADLWTPDYRTPMQDTLLWVYEGQTQFWGLVLAARSGVQTKDNVLGEMAMYAGEFTQEAGRGWRSVEDTTHDEIMYGRNDRAFPDLARTEDYYTEGALTWLTADQIIRKGTAGKKGIDDFAKAFFGIRNGDWGEVTYTFDDVAATLNGIYPYDWAGFLKTHIYASGQPAPLAGIEAAGYHLVWKDTPNGFEKARDEDRKRLNLFFGLGLLLSKDGEVKAGRWDSAAVNAGVVTGAKIIAVNGLAYDEDTIKDAITAAKGTTKPITLIIQRGDRVQSIDIAYHDGLRYPWLERITPGKEPAGLDLLLAARRPGAK